MIEDMATPDLVTMEDSIKEEVHEVVHLPAPWEKPSVPDTKSLVSASKEDISHDEMVAMRELAIAASEQVKRAYDTPTHKFHPRTGRIRTPRETSDSGE